jgi:hypothetical protein
MAKKSATTNVAGARLALRTRVAPDFHRQTVLFQWGLANLGVKDLKEFCHRFQITPDSVEGLDPTTGLHHFHERIVEALPTVADGKVLPADRLRAYEQNILEHTQAINGHRAHHGQPKVDWKYHQYLALLFTEMFLDRFFEDPLALRAEINACIRAHNARVPEVDHVVPHALDEDPRQQMARLAFWCATGSGKTLLMHVNILQFRQYHQRAFQAGKWPALGQVILVTPNDGLSQQHATELTQAGFSVVTAGEAGVDGLFGEHARKAVKIIDIHKFRDDDGKNTFATENFEGCNLVLVDEGHRGAGRGEEGKWLSRRDQLAKGGFCIEYSATFKEAVQGDEVMRNRYARCVLFDYAYRSFYRDGYGKDFSILNLEDDRQQHRYLTAALLLFYQQMRVWMDGGEAIKPFLIDKPLWVFVGHTVVGKATTADDKGTISDVVEVLLFIKRFLENRDESVTTIHDLLAQGFVDQKGRNLLAHKLTHLDTSGDKETLAAEIHRGILRDVFQAPGGGALAVQINKTGAGELALKVGENKPFGVVNVGDPVAVADACAAKGVVRLEDDAFGDKSLFVQINQDDSTINLLVGSRKFTEGWNSWRVCSIGLMHIGKSEGTQIIQLFGRGVRLRGYGMSLRRSTVLTKKPRPPQNIRIVETLQVFGVKADYMARFKDWIFSEVPEAQERQVWDLPVLKTMPKGRILKTIRLMETIEGQKVDRGRAFHDLGPLVVLRPPDNSHEDAWLRQHPATLNWLPKVQGLAAADRTIGTAIGAVVDVPQVKFQPIHVALMDVDELLFGLETYKATHNLDRLHVDRDAIVAMLRCPDWYELMASPADMRPDRYENRTQWQRMATLLLCQYAKKFHDHVRNRWEAPYVEIADLGSDDPSIIGGYSIETTDQVQSQQDIDAIAELVTDLRKVLGGDAVAKWLRWNGEWRTVPFAGHLYQPLLYVGKNAQIRVSPVSLNQHEAKFVEDLAGWCSTNPGREVYLLRNQAVTGLGFFQAAKFFPDFLLWVMDGPRQHLAFVDPKGLHHFGPADPKIQFATRDIPKLQERIDPKGTSLTLHAFTISNTPFASLNWSDGNRLMTRDEVDRLGVLFQTEDAVGYIAAMMSRIVVAAG